jgi:pyruvate formate lyase activating enzyme
VYCHNVETLGATGGEVMEVDELIKKILRYRIYFGERGGVTIGGGEPLLQAGALVPLLQKLKEHGINTALDTSGSLQVGESIKKVIELCDLIILDLKFATEEDYKKNTKGSLKTVLEFMEECERQSKRIWIRSVVVPGLNDTVKYIDSYAALLKGRKIELVELLPFHTLGFDKYETLEIENKLKATRGLTPEKLVELQKHLDSVLLLRS